MRGQRLLPQREQSTVLNGPAQQAQRQAAEDGAWGARTAGRGSNQESARAAGVGESGTNQRMSQYRTGGPGCREERGVGA